MFVVIVAAGLLILLGLVVDGGAKVRAMQRADVLAAEAARAGGQSLNLPAVMAGKPLTVDPDQARTTALAYLTANHVTGTVTLSSGGRQITIDVTTTRPTLFLGLIGVNTLTAHGHATGHLVRDTEATP